MKLPHALYPLFSLGVAVVLAAGPVTAMGKTAEPAPKSDKTTEVAKTSKTVKTSTKPVKASDPAKSAKAGKDAIEVVSQQQSSMHEVAAIQVLSEICPQIIGKNRNFDSGYHLLLSDFLPGFKDPELALQALNENEDYLKALKTEREEAAKSTRENNREVCLGVIQWNKYATKK